MKDSLLKKLPDEIIFKILEHIYHIHHSKINQVLVQEFKSYILQKGDMGSIIISRIQGMPLLEPV